MGKRKLGELTVEEQSAARDYVMARMAAARAAAATAVENIDSFMFAMVNPDSDKKGDDREACLQIVDESLGEAAIATQLAIGVWEDVDAEEGEPDPDDDDDDDDDDEEDEDDEEEEKDEKKKRRR